MTIGPGTTFGQYAIVETIGAGGMGEVWRATDTRLGRDVAIKTLPPGLAQEEDRLARFEREAKLLAALNHPHIGAIYDLNEHEGTLYIAMELIEGETLEEKLKAGALPVEDALRIALQIAQALEAAHEKGVVHRDLKPANVMINNADLVKVLDFGLAKAFSGDPNGATAANSPALSAAMTQQGLILGTAGYMSPEQASGQATDQRADIWAFGVVLFEMLSGLPLFSGESVPHILAEVLKTEPDWGRLPKRLHPRLVQALERCLEKKPRLRYHSIADARVDIETVLSDPAGITPVPGTQAGGAGRVVWPITAALIAGLLVGGLGVFVATRPEPATVARFEVPLASQQIMGTSPSVAISPDGLSIAYIVRGLPGSGGDELRLRSLESLESRLLVAEGRPIMASPFFSPDGRYVGFYENEVPQSLKRVAVEGGSASTIAMLPGALRGASWGDDGSIVFGTAEPQSGLWQVDARGGEPHALTTPRAGEGDHYWPEMLPGGEFVLFTVLGATVEESRIEAFSLVTGERRTVLERAAYPVYSPTGHLLFSRALGLWAVAFDAAAVETRGNPVPVPENALVKGLDRATEISLADNGTLIYVDAVAGDNRALLWVEADGSGGWRETIALPSGGLMETVALSRDRRSAAISALSADGASADVAIVDLDRQLSRPLTRNSGLNRNPIFTEDGQRVVWGRTLNGRAELLWRSVAGSDLEAALMTFEAPVARVVPTAWFEDPTGPILLTLELVDSNGASSIGYISLGEPDSFTPLGSPGFNQSGAAISPDGRWYAYMSDDKGFDEVYVERFPNGGDLQQVSSDGGAWPKWSADGRSLSYVKLNNAGGAVAIARTMLSGADSPDEPLRPMPSKELFEFDYYTSTTSKSSFAMTADGERFLMISSGPAGEGGVPYRTILVQNWAEELKRLVPSE